MTDPTKLIDEPDMAMVGVEEAASLGKQLEIHAGLLKLAVAQNDKQLVSRVLHHLPRFGGLLDETVIAELSAKYSSNDLIGKFLGRKAVEVEKQESRIVEVYAWLLLTYWLVKGQRFQDVLQATSKALEALEAGQHRIFDPLQAKLIFYFCLAHEKLGVFVDMRHKLMLLLRAASLRHDSESSAVIYNWILRSYVQLEQHDLAAKFVEKSPFPAGANAPQASRYHYYMARVCAIQTDYEAAQEHLTQCIRKAPHVEFATGLVQAANKLLVVVQLLLGDIPDRKLFAQPKLALPLCPYFALCQAVRLGDLGRFQKVLNDFHTSFKADKTDSIITRLHQNVLRAGLKRLNKAYIRINLQDVSQKLGLPSVDDAEFVVLKAIKEGVISASVDHGQQFMQSCAIANAYYTRAPHAELHQHIQTAQAIYKQSMMAMRYPEGKAPSAAIEVDSISNEMDMYEEYMDGDDGMDF